MIEKNTTTRENSKDLQRVASENALGTDLVQVCEEII